MPTFSSLMRMRCTLPSQGDVFRSVIRQFRLSQTRNCPAAVPRADRLAGNPLVADSVVVRPAPHVCAPGRVAMSAMAAATKVGASSAPRLNTATSMARADVTRPTVSGSRRCAKSCDREAECGEDHQTDRPPCNRTVLGVDDPEIGDQVDHARCSGGISKNSWQHVNIMSPDFRSNQRPSGRLKGHLVLQTRNLGLDRWRVRFPRQRVQTGGT